jgi:hypothetical protein
LRTAKGIAKYMVDEIKEKYFFFASLLLSFTAATLASALAKMLAHAMETQTAPPAEVLRGAGEKALEILPFMLLAMLFAHLFLGGISASTTLVFRAPHNVDWRQVLEGVLSLQSPKLKDSARTYGFEVKEEPKVRPLRRGECVEGSLLYSRSYWNCKSERKAIPFILKTFAFKVGDKVMLILTADAGLKIFLSSPKCMMKGYLLAIGGRLREKLGRKGGAAVALDPWYELAEDLTFFLDDLLIDLKKYRIELEETVP